MSGGPLARSEGILVQRIDDELVVYDCVDHAAHCLSAQAAAVWELCDGRRSPADIAAELSVGADAVAHALDELADTALLASPPASGLSRREAAKRFAKIGAAAISAPLIYSVAIPHAAAAASGAAGGGGDLCAGVVCDDGNVCTIDTCDVVTGDCVFTPINCDDNNACTIDTCDPVTGCVHTPIVCNDDNPCTRDSCDPRVGKCVFTPVADGTPCGDGTCQSGVCVE
jgi:hypothetical protein